MKKLALFLVLVLLTGLCLSGCGNPHEEMILEAIEELEDYWTDVYDAADELDAQYDGVVDAERGRYFEIKNTRVIEMAEEVFDDDPVYVIEFLLFTDYYGSDMLMSASYTNVLGQKGQSTVLVYSDGSMKVVDNGAVINQYANYHMMEIAGAFEDAGAIIKAVDDYGDAYNCVKTLD